MAPRRKPAPRTKSAPRKAAPRRVGSPQRAREAGVNAVRLAQLLGFTREAVRLWTNDGCPRRDDGSYLVAEVVTWLRKRDREAASRESAPDEAKERARKLRAEADLKELELLERRGQLVERALHRDRVEQIVGGFAAVATGQLARFEKPIIAAATAGDARRVTDRIRTALMQGARTYADQREAEAAELEEPAA